MGCLIVWLGIFAVVSKKRGVERREFLIFLGFRKGSPPFPTRYLLLLTPQTRPKRQAPPPLKTPSPHPPIHPLPPPRSKPPHRPNHHTAPRTNNPQPGKQPAVTDAGDEGLGDDSADAGKDVADEIVDGDARGGLFGHEFREHGCGHGEDEHAADAEEEVGDELWFRGKWNRG